MLAIGLAGCSDSASNDDSQQAQAAASGNSPNQLKMQGEQSEAGRVESENRDPEANSRTDRIRVATFNIALNRRQAGQLQTELEAGRSEAIKKVARVIQRLAPDILLINELDEAPETLALFQQNFLEVSHAGSQPLRYAYGFTAPVNTGVPSGHDLNQDGKTDGPDDAFGYGAFPGQYSMAVLSRFPIQQEEARTFQKFLWKDLPGMKWPQLPDADEPYYDAATREIFRLSSKSHWDVPIQVPGLDGSLHLLASHPTPPVFDGAEDRNGLRNADEIRFWSLYIQGEPALTDDQGRAGGLSSASHFVVAGDLNADPVDGDGAQQVLLELMQDPRMAKFAAPASRGAVEAAEKSGGANANHQGPHKHDTGDFNDRSVGNLRIDHLLPSASLVVVDAGVFWPAESEEGHELADASDHRLVWIDLELQTQ